MQSEYGNNLPRVKISNQTSIRRTIYRHGPITRSDIAERLSLTLPTITTNITHMISRGVLREVESTEVKSNTLGRKAIPVDIAADSRYFIGVEIRQNTRHFCITDYRGETIHTSVDRNLIEDYESNIKNTCDGINRLLQSYIVPREKIGGIGVCATGIVDRVRGFLQAQRQYDWYDKNLQQDIEDNILYHGPITVENNTFARAMGVRLFKRELLNDVPFFAYLYVGNGVSCPLIQNNAGSINSSIGPGELGYMIMESSMPWGKYGSSGNLSALSGERALKDRCKEAMDNGQAPFLKSLSGGERPTMEQILAAQDAGEECICEIIKSSVFYLGVAIANIDNFVRPNTILVDSMLFSKEANRKHFLDTISQNLFRPAFTLPNILFLDYDEFSGARGAAAVAIQTDLDTYID